MTTDVVFLKKNDVVLRPPDQTDVDHLVIWANDPEVTPYINLYLPMTRGDEEKWVERAQNGKPNNICLIICCPECRPVGVVSINGINLRNRIGALGIFIGDKDFQNKGIGTQTITLMIEYAFLRLNLHKLHLSVLEGNERAYKVYAKCGFTEEARFKRHSFREGKYVDEIYMCIFQDEWLKERK